MPHRVGSVGVQYLQRNGATIRFMDSKGKTHSQFIPTSGGEVNGDQHRDLAVAIAEVSNAFLKGVGKTEMREWRDSDATYFDEAYAAVETQLVIVFKHDTDPTISREVIVPALDAQYVLDDGITPDMAHADIQNVVNSAMEILNDDGSGTNPGDFHTYYGYITNRKVGKSVRRVNRNLPPPTEPGVGDSPDGEPDTTPVV